MVGSIQQDKTFLIWWSLYLNVLWLNYMKGWYCIFPNFQRIDDSKSYFNVDKISDSKIPLSRLDNYANFMYILMYIFIPEWLCQ